MKWLSEFRVGFADEYPDFETPKLNLPDNDGFVDWTKPVLWQVGDLKERYTVSQHSNFDFFSIVRWFSAPKPLLFIHDFQLFS